MALTKTLSLQLAAAVTNGVSLSQSLGAPGNFLLNGSLVTGGVATLDSIGASRIVLFTFAGDETGHNFTVTGTDRYGRAQTEVVAGGTGTAATTHDFNTVTKVASDSATASTIQIGTNGTGSTAPWIVDQWANPQTIGANVTQGGTATWSIEEAYDDFSPQWDVNKNSPNWVADTNFSAKTSATHGSLTGTAFTMVRLTITSGTAPVTAKLVQAYAGKTAA